MNDMQKFLDSGRHEADAATGDAHLDSDRRDAQLEAGARKIAYVRALIKSTVRAAGERPPYVAETARMMADPTVGPEAAIGFDREAARAENAARDRAAQALGRTI